MKFAVLANIFGFHSLVLKRTARASCVYVELPHCGSGGMLVASGCVALLRPRTSGGSPLCFMFPPIAHLLLPALCHMYNMSHVLIFYSAVLDVWFK